MAIADCRLWPVHRSIPLGGIRPRGMTRKPMSAEQVEFVQAMALGIFADVSNAGRSFADAIAAVYLSGIDHATNGATK